MIRVAVILVAIMTCPHPSFADDDLVALQGKWRIVEAYFLGNRTDRGEAAVVTIEGDQLYKSEGDGRPYTLSACETPNGPKALDITTYKRMFRGGATILAIYRIEGELLTVCAADVGKPGPTEFPSPGDGLVRWMEILRRMTDD